MPIEYGSAIPILRIFDYDLAVKFYVDWLGFVIDWKHRFSDNAPLYMQVSRGDLRLHLTEHWGDCSPGAAVLIYTDDVEAIHYELKQKPNNYMHPGIEIAPWHAKCMDLVDPFGNKLRFNQPLDESTQSS